MIETEARHWLTCDGCRADEVVVEVTDLVEEVKFSYGNLMIPKDKLPETWVERYNHRDAETLHYCQDCVDDDKAIDLHLEYK